jgi:hypothetical protein
VQLTNKQIEALRVLENDHTIELLFGGGAGGAKSFIGCYWVLKMCIKYPATRWVIGRWKRKYLYETTLNSFWEVCRMQDIKPNEDFTFNSQAGTIRFWNGSEILLKDLFTYPSDPNFDSLGSLEITGAFIDEANQIDVKAKNILKSRIRYKLDENELIPKILYSCNPAKNWVYSEFYKPDRDNELPNNKAFIQALATDNPFISQHYIESLRELPQSSKERLLFGNWSYDDDPARLIEYDNIVNVFSNTFVEEGGMYITCDVARFGKDKTVVMVWSGYRVIKIVTMDKSSMVEVADLINQLRNEYKVSLSSIIVDEDGVGGGAKDILKCKGFVNNSKPLIKENYSNLKSQCYFKMSESMNKNEVYIVPSEWDDVIIEELEQVKQKNVDADGKKAVVPKEQVKERIGRSPDFSDALAMRWYFSIRPKSSYMR